MSTSTSVTFTILNVDEQPPQFDEECSFQVPENTSTNTVIGHCNATDKDNTAVLGDILVTYDIFSNDNEVFQIHKTTGDIFLTGPLDYETKRTYELTIRGTDQSMLVAFKTVDIIIVDTNDNAPQFSEPSYTVNLTPERIRGQTQALLVITVDASDPDSNENGMISYHLGQVTKQDLVTTLEIIARDHGSPALSTSSNITINFEQPCLLQHYTVEESGGRIFANLLCSVEISPSSLQVSLGASSTFQCIISYVGELTLQWIHNGSLISQPTTLVNEQAEVTYTMVDARFDYSGEYACKVTAGAGSLQSATGRVSVLGKNT